MKCHLCDSEAVAIFEFSKGCVCSKESKQPLCLQHIVKSTPLGTMICIQDLSVDNAFTKWWGEYCGTN